MEELRGRKEIVVLFDGRWLPLDSLDVREVLKSVGVSTAVDSPKSRAEPSRLGI